MIKEKINFNSHQIIKFKFKLENPVQVADSGWNGPLSAWLAAAIVCDGNMRP